MKQLDCLGPKLGPISSVGLITTVAWDWVRDSNIAVVNVQTVLYLCANSINCLQSFYID